MLKGLKTYFFSTIILTSTAAWSQNLEDIYQQVLQSDPRLLTESLGVEVLAARQQQAFGALLPQVSISSSWTENQRIVEGSSKESFAGERHSLSVQQALIDMPKYYGWKITEDRYEQKLLEQKDLRSKVRFDTIERYFNLLNAIDELALVREEKESAEKTKEHIGALYQMQRVKVTDFYEAEAQLDLVLSKEIDAMQKRDLAKEDLRELTNNPVKDISKLSENNEFIQRAENINEWSADSISSNYALMALRKKVEAAQKEIDKQSAGHLPLLAIQLSKQKSDIGFENTAASSSTTEVASLTFQVPLFSGGQTSARVYEATSILAINRAQYDMEKRRVNKESRDMFLHVNATARRIEATNKAIKSAQKAYQSMNRSFELGIATVSQLLIARKAYSEAKREYMSAKYSYINGKAKLLHISGKLNDAALYEISKWLL